MSFYYTSSVYVFIGFAVSHTLNFWKFKIEECLFVLGLLVLKYVYFFAFNTHCALVVVLSEKKQAIGNVELMHECFSNRSCMGTTKMK